MSKFFVAALIIVWPTFTLVAEPATLDAYLVKRIESLVELPESAAKEFVSNILKYSAAYRLDPYLVTAIITVESHFRHFRSKHDFGPMQVNRFWFNRLDVDESDLLQIEGGIKTGTQILAINQMEKPNDTCWWSSYNSQNPVFRRIYEKKVLHVLKQLNQDYSCEDDYE